MHFNKKRLIACLLVGVAVVGWCVRQPVKIRMTDWRAEKNLESYREAADAGEWDQAFRHALSAHQLKPDQLDPLMALLRVGVERKGGSVFSVAMRVLQHRNSSSSEKAEAMDVFLKTGDVVVFQRLYQQLPETDRQHPEMLRIYAGYLSQKERFSEAASIYESLSKTGGDPELILSQAAMLVRSAAVDATAGARSQELIVQLLEGTDRKLGLRALRLFQLLPRDQWSVDAMVDATAWVKNHELAITADHLLVYAIQIAADEGQRARILQEAVSRFGVGQPALVARWLGVLEEYDLALDVLDEAAALQSPDAFMARTVILHRAGRLDEVGAWLENPHPGIQASVVFVLRAVLTPPEQASKFWEKALISAELEDSAKAFWRISKSAVSVGNHDIGMRAAVEALKRPGAHPPIIELSDVLAWLYRNDRGDDLLQVCRTLIRREPESPILRNNLAYLEVVSGHASDQAVTALENLQKEFPSIPQFATSHAVACLARGEYANARKILESTISDWSDAATPALAAYAVTLGSGNERGSDADSALASLYKTMSERVRWNEMLSVEREFFQSRIAAAGLSSAEVDSVGSPIQ